jgi:hypothetical protein
LKQAEIERKMSKWSYQFDQDTASEATTDKPVDWDLHTPMFHLTQKGDEEWSTHLGTSHTHLHLVVSTLTLSVSGRPMSLTMERKILFGRWGGTVA